MLKRNRESHPAAPITRQSGAPHTAGMFVDDGAALAQALEASRAQRCMELRSGLIDIMTAVCSSLADSAPSHQSSSSSSSSSRHPSSSASSVSLSHVADFIQKLSDTLDAPRWGSVAQYLALAGLPRGTPRDVALLEAYRRYRHEMVGDVQPLTPAEAAALSPPLPQAAPPTRPPRCSGPAESPVALIDGVRSATVSVASATASERLTSSASAAPSASTVAATQTRCIRLVPRHGATIDASPLAASSASVPPSIVCWKCTSRSPLRDVPEWPLCGHSMCCKCVEAQLSTHAMAAGATLHNVQCSHPHHRSGAHADVPLWSASKLSRLIADDSALLRTFAENEVASALGSVGTMKCPVCHVLQVLPAPPADGSPAPLRMRCNTCHETFCSSCNVSPFHDDRRCASTTACRYCGDTVTTGDDETGFPMCGSERCRQLASAACCTVLACGHTCYGCVGETAHVPCLHDGCATSSPAVRGDDYCNICFVDQLKDAPCVRNGTCGHVVHWHCMKAKLDARWPTARISFGFLMCPVCNIPIEKADALSGLQRELGELLAIKQAVETLFGPRLAAEGALARPEIATDASSRYYQKPNLYAWDNLLYFQCSRCKAPYFGGMKHCDDNIGAEVRREELICGPCTGLGITSCGRHGTDGIEFKCRFCCNTASFFCFGTTHFCESCHKVSSRVVVKPCPGADQCPQRGAHPPNGTEFALGCGLCGAGVAETAAKAGAPRIAPPAAQARPKPAKPAARAAKRRR